MSWPPKGRSAIQRRDAAERRAAIQAENGWPTPIDVWIVNALNDPHAQTYINQDIDARANKMDYLLFQDMVQCVLKVVNCEGTIEGPFQDPPTSTLTMHLVLPPMSGFLVYVCKSPTVIVSSFQGWPADRPDWVQLIGEGKTIWQPRPIMLGFLQVLCDNEENENFAPRVRDWCSSVVIPASSPALTMPVGGPSQTRPSTIARNTRSHKPRTSDLTDYESQLYRMKLNKTYSEGKLA